MSNRYLRPGLGSRADTIWAGTTRREASWAWVKFLGSQTAQDIVAKAGVVFPAVAASMPAAKAAFAKNGWDVTPFLEPVEAGDVFPYPANPNAADVTAVMTPAMDAVMSFEADPSSLSKANNDVNKILSANA